MKLVEDAWQEKSQAAEAERTQHLLAEAVRTARWALTSELQRSESQSSIDIFKRWSLLEESAGNYLEAGLQAEKAQDYFAASVLFEKANAFGQALVALESASPKGLDSHKKAQLLEQGGNFFLAGLLYERLGEIDGFFNGRIIQWWRGLGFKWALDLEDILSIHKEGEKDCKDYSLSILG
ncbi:hypothetical protein [Chlorogloea sp. CCALA 695]|uniref:hypothetical protein n=1 Tax=Chlorogloea sp. CCALA 695 TaxID=2107693 RepID=UPI0013049B27|nr:hypothetical protein [Chlorogloea sp. CCALA 695]